MAAPFAAAVTLLLVVLAVAVPHPGAEASDLARFRTWPHLKCSACEAVVDVLGHFMNESRKDGVLRTIQTSHRLDANNKLVRQDVRKTDVHASEMLHKTCEDKDNFRDFSMKEDSKYAVPIFSREGALMGIYPTTSKDKEDYYEQSTVSKVLQDACLELMSEYDDFLAELVKKDETFDDIVEAFCVKKTKFCGSAAFDKAQKAAITKHAAWKKKRGMDAPPQPTPEEQKKREEAQKKQDEANARIAKATGSALDDELEEVEVEMEVDDNETAPAPAAAKAPDAEAAASSSGDEAAPPTESP